MPSLMLVGGVSTVIGILVSCTAMLSATLPLSLQAADNSARRFSDLLGAAAKHEMQDLAHAAVMEQLSTADRFRFGEEPDILSFDSPAKRSNDTRRAALRGLLLDRAIAFRALDFRARYVALGFEDATRISCYYLSAADNAYLCDVVDDSFDSTAIITTIPNTTTTTILSSDNASTTTTTALLSTSAVPTTSRYLGHDHFCNRGRLLLFFRDGVKVSELVSTDPHDPRAHAWYRNVKNDGGALARPRFSHVEVEPHYQVTVVTVDGPLVNASGHFIGVVSVGIELGDISQKLSEIPGTGGHMLMLLDRDGYLLGSSDLSPTTAVIPLEDGPRFTQRGAVCSPLNQTHDLCRYFPHSAPSAKIRALSAAAPRFFNPAHLDAASSSASSLHLTQYTVSTEGVERIAVPGSGSRGSGDYYFAMRTVTNRYISRGLDWRIIVAVPSIDLLREIEEGRNLALYLAAAVVVAICVCSCVGLWVVLKPLRTVVDAMHQAAAFRFGSSGGGNSHADANNSSGSTSNSRTYKNKQRSSSISLKKGNTNSSRGGSGSMNINNAPRPGSGSGGALIVKVTSRFSEIRTLEESFASLQEQLIQARAFLPPSLLAVLDATPLSSSLNSIDKGGCGEKSRIHEEEDDDEEEDEGDYGSDGEGAASGGSGPSSPEVGALLVGGGPSGSIDNFFRDGDDDHDEDEEANPVSHHPFRHPMTTTSVVSATRPREDGPAPPLLLGGGDGDTTHTRNTYTTHSASASGPALSMEQIHAEVLSTTSGGGCPSSPGGMEMLPLFHRHPRQSPPQSPGLSPQPPRHSHSHRHGHRQSSSSTLSAYRRGAKVHPTTAHHDNENATIGSSGHHHRRHGHRPHQSHLYRSVGGLASNALADRRVTILHFNVVGFHRLFASLLLTTTTTPTTATRNTTSTTGATAATISNNRPDAGPGVGPVVLAKLQEALRQKEVSAGYAALVRSVDEAAQAHGGIVDSFSGDRFTIGFNALKVCPMHPTKAVLAAQQLRDVMLSGGSGGGSGIGCKPSHNSNGPRSGDHAHHDHHSHQSERARAALQHTTCGIASGPATVGNLGAADVARRFSIIGPVVTRAAALERLCRVFPLPNSHNDNDNNNNDNNNGNESSTSLRQTKTRQPSSASVSPPHVHTLVTGAVAEDAAFTATFAYLDIIQLPAGGSGSCSGYGGTSPHALLPPPRPTAVASLIGTHRSHTSNNARNHNASCMGASGDEWMYELAATSGSLLSASSVVVGGGGGGGGGVGDTASNRCGGTGVWWESVRSGPNPTAVLQAACNDALAAIATGRLRRRSTTANTNTNNNTISSSPPPAAAAVETGCWQQDFGPARRLLLELLAELWVVAPPPPAAPANEAEKKKENKKLEKKKKKEPPSNHLDSGLKQQLPQQSQGAMHGKSHRRCHPPNTAVLIDTTVVRAALRKTIPQPTEQQQQQHQPRRHRDESHHDGSDPLPPPPVPAPAAAPLLPRPSPAPLLLLPPPSIPHVLLAQSLLALTDACLFSLLCAVGVRGQYDNDNTVDNDDFLKNDDDADGNDDTDDDEGSEQRGEDGNESQMRKNLDRATHTATSIIANTTTFLKRSLPAFTRQSFMDALYALRQCLREDCLRLPPSPPSSEPSTRKQEMGEEDEKEREDSHPSSHSSAHSGDQPAAALYRSEIVKDFYQRCVGQY